MAQRLYQNDGSPSKKFNSTVLNWLTGGSKIREHATPAAFESTRVAYDKQLAALSSSTGGSRVAAHTKLLSNLTTLMFGIDLSGELAERLSDGLINEGGIRSTVSQGVVKNVGENFVNLIVYALADLLSHQDEVLVDKGTPPLLKPYLRVERDFAGTIETKSLHLDIECDFCIFSRSDPSNALIVSAKTRLKEVFHIGTMWSLFFRMIGDQHCQDKWGIKTAKGDASKMHYVFATSDSIREGGKNSQGPDIKPGGVRNLLCADASFFDYVFVSKSGLDYVSGSLNLTTGRESLFHELGCLVGMVKQKYDGLVLRDS